LEGCAKTTAVVRRRKNRAFMPRVCPILPDDRMTRG
jgi:hypothetical protein